MTTDQIKRTIGLMGATRIGIGAIVGGGILVLAGPTFQATGPSAILAFALNGLLAFMTAMSFAEMVSAYPRSGGAYAFGRRVLSVRVAFGLGWVIWFAYIVAGVLYALGFGIYGARLLQMSFSSIGFPTPQWLLTHGGAVGLAVVALIVYTASLIRHSSGGGKWSAWGKVVVLGFLALVGLWVLMANQPLDSFQKLSPFFSDGTIGLLSAMGISFIAFQGFDLVATVASEIKEPARNAPRAMFYSLGAALVIYLPLLLVVATVGTGEHGHVSQLAADGADTLMATAVGHYMGPAGVWLVLIAAVLATLSALHANLLAASRVAQTMATDRTLPWIMGVKHERYGTPSMAVYSSALAMGALLFMLPDLSAAGSAASLIFLVTFAMTHYTAYLARKRSRRLSADVYLAPLFPVIPVVGGLACLGLAVWQAIREPNAGAITLVWLGLGFVLYRSLFAFHAQVLDAAAEAGDTELLRLRGRSPLMIVPVRNPRNAKALMQLAAVLTPPTVGRVMLLSVVRNNAVDAADEIKESLLPLQHGLETAQNVGHAPRAMTTFADDPWEEIARVAEDQSCERLLLGLTELQGQSTVDHLEALVNRVKCDLSILRAPSDWKLEQVQRVLVPVGGQGNHDELRARLLASLRRNRGVQITLLRVIPMELSEADETSIEQNLSRRAKSELGDNHSVVVQRSADPRQSIIDMAGTVDLLILGLQRGSQNRKAIGSLSIEIAQKTETAMVLLGGR
ncbi:MAG: amino acid permease [Myxococcota bacterium]|nr:amino acid permease [Myxococcota bacterium]